MELQDANYLLKTVLSVHSLNPVPREIIVNMFGFAAWPTQHLV